MIRSKTVSIFRCLACVGAFIVHFGIIMNFKGSLRVLTDFGAEGVSIFFMLSGFLATSKKVSGIKGGLKYYLNRAIRILPCYYLVVFYYFFVLRDRILFEQDVYGWKRYFLLANCIVPSGGGSGIILEHFGVYS